MRSLYRLRLYNTGVVFSSAETNRIEVDLRIKLAPLNGDYRAASSLPTTAFCPLQVPNDVQQAFYQLVWEAEPLALFVFYLLMGTVLWKYYSIVDSSARPTPEKNGIAYCISSLIEIPPSFNMGVTNSARYNQIWGISMAISSAISKVSEKLQKKKEKCQALNTI